MSQSNGDGAPSDQSDTEPVILDEEYFGYSRLDIWTKVYVTEREIAITTAPMGAGTPMLSPGEARSFALALMRMADQAEGKR